MPKDRTTMTDAAGRGSPWTPLWIALALGTAWLSIETAHAVLGERTVGAAETLRRFAGALPWQLGFFVLLALPAMALRASPAASGGWILAAATGVFLAARVAEGLLKRENLPPGQTAAWVGGMLAVAAAPLLLTGLARLAPGRWRTGVAPALWVAWMLVFVPALQRGAPTLGFARLPESGVLLHGPELLFAAAMAVTLAAAVARPRLAVLPLLVLLAPFARAALGPDGASLDAPADDARPNVILAVIDTLRADHLLSEAHAGQAPEIGRFLDDAFRFERAYSPGNRTLVAMPGVMTSLPSVSVGVRISPDARTLAEHLKDAGYSTVGVSANPLVSHRTGYAQGFDVLSDSFDWPSYQVGDLRRVLGVALPGSSYHLGVASSEFYYRPGSDVRRRALHLLERAEPPTLLYVHTMDMHGPYLPPRDLLGPDYRGEDFLSYFTFIRKPPEELRRPDGALAAGIRNLRQRYAGELRFTDVELGRFFAALRESGDYEESLIWLLSDHGESFGERGYAGHGGMNTTPSVLRVPLALKPPRSWGLEPRPIDVPVSTADVLPTTLSLLGLPPPELAVGADLAGLLRGDDAVRALPIAAMAQESGDPVFSFVEGPWQLDVRVRPDGRLAEHRLYSTFDEEQGHDYRNRQIEAASRLEARAREFLGFANRARARTWEREFDAQTREQLRRLGYIE